MVAPSKSKGLSARHWEKRGEVDVEKFFLICSIQLTVDYCPYFVMCKNAILFSQDQDFAAQIDTILLILNFKARDFLKVVYARTRTKPE